MAAGSGRTNLRGSGTHFYFYIYHLECFSSPLACFATEADNFTLKKDDLAVLHQLEKAIFSVIVLAQKM